LVNSGFTAKATNIMRCSSLMLRLVLFAIWGSVCCGWLWADGSPDRIYGLGDDMFEGAAQGNVLGTGNAFGDTYDSWGTPLFGDLQDLEVFGNPVYADVSGRPLFVTGLGASFDGVGDYLRGANLNLPATSAASVNNDDDPIEPSLPGPLNYTNIVDRYFQMWVKPDSASQAVTQSVAMDTNQHGVRIVGGNWSMRYAGTDFDSGSAVAFDTWSHVMLARPFGPPGGSRLYINGVAVTAAPGGYDGSATEELVVGSDTSRDENRNFTGGTTEFYHGLIDNLDMFILGDNTDVGGQDWGDFEFHVDNEFAADVLSGVQVADVNLDGMVDGDGTQPAAIDDVTAFVEGWLFENNINGVRVGDLVSRAQGDLNFDGITNLPDWAILNAANPALGAAIADQLFAPEPGGLALSMWLLLLLGLRRIGGPLPARAS
jgi:hypothetical protein